MKFRIARLGVLFAGVVGLMGTMTPPVSATTVKVLAFTAFATAPNGFAHPDEIPCTSNLAACFGVKADPKGFPDLNLNQSEGKMTGFSLGSIVCTKVSVSTDPGKKFPGPALCSFAVYGLAWGYCGLAGGAGIAVITNTGLGVTGSLKATESIYIKFTVIAGVMYLTGGDATRNLRAVIRMSEVPTFPPQSPGCPTEYSTSWVGEGDAVFKDIT